MPNKFHMVLLPTTAHQKQHSGFSLLPNCLAPFFTSRGGLFTWA